MAYPNSFGYDPFYRLDTSFHPPTSLPDFNEYIHLTNYSFSSYHQMSCHNCQDQNNPSEQCPSIGYSLGLGQNQFHTFQGLRASLIQQTSIWRVEIVLNFHRINHIKILNLIGPPLNHHLYLGI